MTRNNQHIDTVWEFKTKISQRKFESFDFSRTNFNSAIFENVIFENCLFFKTNLNDSRLFYQSCFEGCEFSDTNLSNSAFGNNKGTYKNCIFERCNFKGLLFDFTKFINCTFTKLRYGNTNFNGSTFENCRFIGKMTDVTFNGIYNTNPIPTACLNKVDFSQAFFDEFVTFCNCDLTTCISPKGLSFSELLYQIESEDPSILSTGSKDRIVLD